MNISYYDERIDKQMDTVTLSPKYQVVIPLRVRESLRLRPGERFQVINYDGRVELIPVKKMRDTRGCVRGMDTRIVRDDDRV